MRVLIGLFILILANLAEAKNFITIGVAGYGIVKKDPSLIETLQPGDPASGAWNDLPTSKDDPKILHSIYLSHWAVSGETTRVLAYFGKAGQCDANLGVIIFANSWGSGKAASLAEDYQKYCGHKVDLFVMVDGVQQPITNPFTGIILADRCVNYYQTASFLHGVALSDCENNFLNYPINSNQDYIVNNHVKAEWEASQKAKDLSLQFIKAH